MARENGDGKMKTLRPCSLHDLLRSIGYFALLIHGWFFTITLPLLNCNPMASGFVSTVTVKNETGGTVFNTPVGVPESQTRMRHVVPPTPWGTPWGPQEVWSNVQQMLGIDK